MLGAVALGLVAWMVYAEMKPLNRNELKIEVASLRSLAADGRLLGEQTLAGRTTKTFFGTENYLLHDKVATTRQGLDSDSVESGLEGQLSQARQLAAQLQSEYQTFSTSFENQAGLTVEKDRFDLLRAQLKQLEESLKQ